MNRVYTIGHSTRPLAEFIGLLKSREVSRLIDVRTIPRSRMNPQFNADTLRPALNKEGIGYMHMKGLGGLRHPLKVSSNAGWKNASFRGFADYMQTEEFAESLEELIHAAGMEVIAIMCAEALPWRCHRSLISDALVVRGIEPLHIMSASKDNPHRLTGFAKTDGLKVTYPDAGEKDA